ncbi:hypothetical protein KIPB_010750 [Kipferlia bialata]|uniref:Uncharacterized protein n=1 Tax=Kipferlia bialata TaxID=797122 RepID=A0A391NQ09_9EUKA|nr:hypothetical protein KIPB_010750 [Kipferlia bialata]|eukprot:g10750.t1
MGGDKDKGLHNWHWLDEGDHCVPLEDLDRSTYHYRDINVEWKEGGSWVGYSEGIVHPDVPVGWEVCRIAIKAHTGLYFQWHWNNKGRIMLCTGLARSGKADIKLTIQGPRLDKC